eukprot:gnl/Chilomastix_cuspidata/238.p2 GENE.gnl/Chilomastix_cuspidata/238~~gnl/Chilomastix_cuspidata/238.p2  ORF type:complete len:215 (-),score=26.84 gnl/Chilomastix_cuspidata/238:23-667(-)
MRGSRSALINCRFYSTISLHSARMVFPPVVWAEREPLIFLTVQVSDLTNVEVKYEEQKVIFEGDKESKHYAVTIPLREKIDPEKCSHHVTGFNCSIVLTKAEPKWWCKLVVGRNPGWLKVDWDRWADQDSEKAKDMPEMGGMPDMGGMGGMPGMGGMGGMGGMPDLSALQGMDGMPDLSALQGMGADGKFDFDKLGDAADEEGSDDVPGIDDKE